MDLRAELDRIAAAEAGLEAEVRGATLRAARTFGFQSLDDVPAGTRDAVLEVEALTLRQRRADLARTREMIERWLLVAQ